MNNIFEISDAVELFKEQLNSGGKVSFVPKGISMKPMLSGRSKVVLEKPKGRLKKYDLPLFYYKKTNSYIIHRVVGFAKDGTYITCGDNMIATETDITHDDVIAVVIGFEKNGKNHSVKELSYKIYCRYINLIRPLRRMYAKLRQCFLRKK